MAQALLSGIMTVILLGKLSCGGLQCRPNTCRRTFVVPTTALRPIATATRIKLTSLEALESF